MYKYIYFTDDFCRLNLNRPIRIVLSIKFCDIKMGSHTDKIKKDGFFTSLSFPLLVTYVLFRTCKSLVYNYNNKLKFSFIFQSKYYIVNFIYDQMGT